MYCRFCGNEIVDDAVVCIHCGRAIGPIAESGINRNTHSNEITFGISQSNLQAASRSVNKTIKSDDTLAIIAFVLALLGFFTGISFIPSIVCGHVALARSAKGHNSSGKGLAIAALVMSYAAIFVGIFIFILFALALVGSA